MAFTTSTFLILAGTLLGAALSFSLWRLLQPRIRRATHSNTSPPPEKTRTPGPDIAAYNTIEPLSSFDHATTPPIRICPFKPAYHLSMSLEKLPFSDLLEFDDTYLPRLRLRKELLAQHPAATYECRKGAEPAVLELYAWLTSTYLPRRFPTIFTLGTSELHNRTTGRALPLKPSSATAALVTLGENIDTDFLLLLPTSPSTETYSLRAFVNCFPSGFSTRAKCGMNLAEIHAPVPGYAAKLEKSMDRFFARLEVGKLVRRTNWAVTTNSDLFAEEGNHLYVAEEAGDGEAEVEKQRAEIRIEECRLRCERQTLHRLPETGALVFAFKTYQYTLDEVKAEGSGPELAAAIDGLGAGSVPGMAVYKRGIVWGEKVKAFLLS